ncbi:alpha/beta fold hydrolase [Paraflavisolibacter sp. H34]|uniref:alpha/beta hydrolase n=1 Tax=Huijunlia imazamoxiresistens TaxID=3127457 RepID=UPI00301921C3
MRVKNLSLKYIRTKFKLLSAISKRKAAEQAFLLFTTPLSRVRKKLPDSFRQAQKLQFSFRGEKITGYRWNHPSDKKVLILHGYQSSILNFEQYVRPLVKAGFEVLGFDAPAHGRSTGKRITVLVYKDFIHYIHKHYGPVTNYVAHSLGGLALSHYLEELPHDRSYRAVLIAPATETTTAVEHLFSLLRLDDGVRQEFDRIIEREGRHPASWFSVARACKQIRAEVLWLQDREDRQTPFSDVEPIIRQQHPHIRFHLTSGLGHSQIYHDSHSRQAILDFLVVPPEKH